ncbi:hypothetical protein CEUSTIGMA_g9068.t1 [Chlamydomonas eustigma]|uniref:CCT domain-containing protein n=1 Tax=Chlamydomonas eustigma TaxID=1157962 RepID=A0A250XFS2_9CHLO|nr:hypothetical protein CEUSTIGMA_g9068.t1 [Chlamydomonas eustigma]|eukprot:GAX81640.1 hypothetical protein CEUSTIGMA_g9068.t1 [Chlamydomonas eustigma]
MIISTEFSVLVVDSDNASGDNISQLLKDCSYKVCQCSTDTEALDLLKKQSCIKLILKEHEPGLLNHVDQHGTRDGTNFLKLLSSSGITDVPVVFYSSNGESEEVVKCLGVGAVDYLVKPVRQNELKHIWARLWCWKQSGLPIDKRPADHTQAAEVGAASNMEDTRPSSNECSGRQLNGQGSNENESNGQDQPGSNEIGSNDNGTSRISDMKDHKGELRGSSGSPDGSLVPVLKNSGHALHLKQQQMMMSSQQGRRHGTGSSHHNNEWASSFIAGEQPLSAAGSFINDEKEQQGAGACSSATPDVTRTLHSGHGGNRTKRARSPPRPSAAAAADSPVPRHSSWVGNSNHSHGSGHQKRQYSGTRHQGLEQLSAAALSLQSESEDTVLADHHYQQQQQRGGHLGAAGSGAGYGKSDQQSPTSAADLNRPEVNASDAAVQQQLQQASAMLYAQQQAMASAWRQQQQQAAVTLQQQLQAAAVLQNNPWQQTLQQTGAGVPGYASAVLSNMFPNANQYANNLQPGVLSYSLLSPQAGSAHAGAFNTQTMNLTSTNLLQQSLLPYTLPQLAGYSLQKPAGYSQVAGQQGGLPVTLADQSSSNGMMRQYSTGLSAVPGAASLLQQQQLGSGLQGGGGGHTASYNLLMNYMTQTGQVPSLLLFHQMVGAQQHLTPPTSSTPSTPTSSAGPSVNPSPQDLNGPPLFSVLDSRANSAEVAAAAAISSPSAAAVHTALSLSAAPTTSTGTSGGMMSSATPHEVHKAARSSSMGGPAADTAGAATAAAAADSVVAAAAGAAVHLHSVASAATAPATLASGITHILPGGLLAGHLYHHHHQHLTTLSGVQERRLVALARYRDKRNSRKYGKVIRYESRHRQAQARPRVKGQFVKHITPAASSDMMEGGQNAEEEGGAAMDNVCELTEDAEEEEEEVSLGRAVTEVVSGFRQTVSGNLTHRNQSASGKLGLVEKAAEGAAAGQTAAKAKAERDDRDMADCLRFLKDSGLPQQS